MNIIGLMGTVGSGHERVMDSWDSRGGYVLSLRTLQRYLCNSEGSYSTLRDLFLARYGLAIMEEDGEHIDYELLDWFLHSSGYENQWYHREVQPELFRVVNQALLTLEEGGVKNVLVEGICVCTDLDLIRGVSRLLFVNAPLEERKARAAKEENITDDDFSRRVALYPCIRCGIDKMETQDFYNANSSDDFQSRIDATLDLIDFNLEDRLFQIEGLQGNPYLLDQVSAESYSESLEDEKDRHGILTRDPEYDDVDTFE